MKAGTRTLAAVIFAGSMALVGCSSSSEETTAQECHEPDNPYGDDGGHDAGFKWAQENSGEDCDGDSDSFNEGCQEYHRQLDEYYACISSSK